MLSRHFSGQGRAAARQQGVVLIIALIVLVAMTLAAVALVRSVDTGNVIAGNLAFQQAATHSADAGTEAAISWLEDCGKTHVTCAASTLETDSPTHGYSATGSKEEQNPRVLQPNPKVVQSWDAYWAETLASRAVTLRLGADDSTADAAGNTVSYVIDRMCSGTGSATSGGACAESPVVARDPENAEEGGESQVSGTSVIYYRITVRVTGPKNTVSYVQSMIAM